MAPFDLQNLIFAVILLPFAVFRLCRLAIEDVIFNTPRQAIWKRFPPESSKIGYLLTCYWCLSLWISAIMVVLYLLLPVFTLVLAGILALSAVASLIDHKLNS